MYRIYSELILEALLKEHLITFIFFSFFKHLSAEELARRREEEKLKPLKSAKGSRQIKRYYII